MHVGAGGSGSSNEHKKQPHVSRATVCTQHLRGSVSKTKREKVGKEKVRRKSNFIKIENLCFQTYASFTNTDK